MGEKKSQGFNGKWTGFFRYPDPSLAPVEFTGEFSEAKGMLSGEIRENGPDKNTLLISVVSGIVEKNAVRFVKFYKDAGEEYGEVMYRGILDSSGNSLHGRWTTIEDQPWSGEFTLHRGDGHASTRMPLSKTPPAPPKR